MKERLKLYDKQGKEITEMALDPEIIKDITSPPDGWEEKIAEGIISCEFSLDSLSTIGGEAESDYISFYDEGECIWSGTMEDLIAALKEIK